MTIVILLMEGRCGVTRMLSEIGFGGPYIRKTNSIEVEILKETSQ